MASLFRSRSCGLIDTNATCTSYRNETQRKEKKCKTREIGKDSVGSLHSISMSSSFHTAEIGGNNNNQFALKDVLIAALRKSLVTCSVEKKDASPSNNGKGDGMIIGWPTDVKHVSHVTFDRLNGFHGLPEDLLPQIPRRVPSASVKVFGVSPNSMQCSYDDKGNSVPTILLMIQRRLYVEGGLKAEGIFRINAENSQEEYVRDELNNGTVPRGIDVHCLAGLIKAWFRELPSGLLDSLTPEQVRQCASDEDCIELVKVLPPTETALLNWAVNLMADVVEHQQYNKMNAHNVAMVFAPNLTQMADPLIALMHAVELMNLLKSLILKTLRQREELKGVTEVGDNYAVCRSIIDGYGFNGFSKNPSWSGFPAGDNMGGCGTNERLEFITQEKLWNLGGQRVQEMDLRPPSIIEHHVENETESLVKECHQSGEKMSFTEGVKRLCRHPVFQLSKAAKKTRDVGIVDAR